MFRLTHLKVNIWKAAPPTEGPVDLQYRLIVLVRNDEFWGERVPLLRNVPHRVTGGRLHLQLCGIVGERSVICSHILTRNCVYCCEHTSNMTK